MIINNKYKTRIIGLCSLLLLFFSYHGFCQSHSIIDIDKTEILKLPEGQKEAPIPDGMLSFNDIIKVKGNSKTSYAVEYIPVYQSPTISKGSIYINLNNKRSVYDLESVNKITNENNLYHFEYIVNKYSKKEYTVNDIYKSMFGEHPSKIVNYLVSVDAATGDTLWKKQKDYISVHLAKHVSIVGNLIIDNKTGKELFKLSSSNPISISEVKEDEEHLYLKTNGNELIAIDLQKGEAIWRVKGDFNKFFIDESRIYTSSQCAIDKNTGKIIWNNSSDVWFVGIVGDYLIGYQYGEDDPEVFVYNKNTGKLAGYLWSDNEFCTSCLGYEFCNPEFIFAEQGEGNKTTALVKCSDGVYLYTFEVK